ncbi:MAG: MmcQ/YjbR family DNA-binding protein [Mucilaginibacter polytrichastri]|nr:MmcQ/YjbR family DNA-binding protein [Mucilaginibacter polytrichastri]
MITEENFCAMALSFEGTEQRPHFDRWGFRVQGKRMYASYLAANNTANVFLRPAEQQLFCAADPQHIYPVPNKWGEKGATTFVLSDVSPDILQEALRSAYEDVIRPKKG